MTDLLNRSYNDFFHARRKALMQQVLGFLRRRPNRLLSFEEVREKLHLGGPIYRGVETVPLAHILGSLNRYHDFDRAFLPTQSHTADRWMRINRAWYREEALPPVLLYKVGEVYFVVDGNHRVSVARDQGQEFIDAEVREYRSRVPLSATIRPEDLERLEAEVDFLERTGIDRLIPGIQVRVTVLGAQERLLEHIAVHRYFMGLEARREVSEAEALLHWYRTLYQPVVEVIEASGILSAFPARTPADLYLWVMDHRHYLLESEEFKHSAPGEAARHFVQLLVKGRLRRPE
jgi:hypothetical protein